MADTEEPPPWFRAHHRKQLDREREHAKAMDQMSSDLDHVTSQMRSKQKNLESLTQFVAAKQRSDIRKLKVLGRDKILHLTQADSDQAKEDWDAYLQSLSSADYRMLKHAGFTKDVVKATELDNIEKLLMSAACQQADYMIAAAVTDLPGRDKEQYIDLFEAVYGKQSYDIIDNGLQKKVGLCLRMIQCLLYDSDPLTCLCSICVFTVVLSLFLQHIVFARLKKAFG